jgi:isochorismate pyruvate lyase
MVTACASLAEVRANIDRLDGEIVRLLGERLQYVLQAARFKRTAVEVAAPDRVEQVIAHVRALAVAHDLPPDPIERVYRPLIATFITLEADEHARRRAPEETT